MKTPVLAFTLVVFFFMPARNIQAQCTSKTKKLPINALFKGSTIDGISVPD